MRKLLTVAFLALVAGWLLRAQVSVSSPSYAAIPSSAVAAGCPAPTVGFTIYCQAADKFQVSANGAAYIVIWPAVATVAGVTSISTNGGATKQVGDVVLTIPGKVTITSTGVLQ